MHKQHPQTAYRKYAVLIGTIYENCDRVGDYRILYTVEEEIITVRVTDAGNRGDIYK